MAMPVAREMEVGMEEGPRGAPAQVGDVDDAAAANLAHFGDGATDQPDGAPYLQVEVVLPFVVGDILEGLGQGDAGVVDQDVHPAVGVQGSLHHLVGRIGVGNVGGDGQYHALGRSADVRGGLVQSFLIAGHDYHPRALFGHALGGGLADALAAAGYDGNFVSQSEIHSLTSLDSKIHPPERASNSGATWPVL